MLNAHKRKRSRFYPWQCYVNAVADVTDTVIIDKYKHGLLQGWSFGFKPLEVEIEQRNGKTPRRHVKELDLFEVSIIDDRQTPCYNGTLIECRSEDAEELSNAKKDLESIINAYYLNMVDFEQVKRAIEKADAVSYEVRYNPNHDPTNGQFCDGTGSSSGGLVHYVAKGRKGKGEIMFAGLGGGAESESLTNSANDDTILDEHVVVPNRYQKDLVDTAETDNIVNRFEHSGIEYNEVDTLDNRLSEQEIINKIGGEDFTDGSCLSQALAYVANENGYDVTDYKGGKSCDYFSTFDTDIRGVHGVLSISSEKSDFKAVSRLTSAMLENETYILSAGTHSAVVKKSGGAVSYLELQGSSSENGFKALTKTALKNRFNCSTKTSGKTATLINGNALSMDKNFKTIMGYLNTK